MGIKAKQKGPKPNVPSDFERWQVLALNPERHTEAVQLVRATYPTLGLVEAARRVKSFHKANQGKFNV